MTSVVISCEKSHEEMKKLVKMVLAKRRCVIIRGDAMETGNGDDSVCTLRGFVSRVQRNDHIEPIQNADLVLIYVPWLQAAENIDKVSFMSCSSAVYCAQQLHKTVLIAGANNWLAEQMKKYFSHAVEVIDYDALIHKGGSLMLRSEFYDEIVLREMGGNNEIHGYNQYDGVCQVVCEKLSRLNDFANGLSNVKDVLSLDVSFENVVKFCKNQAMPGVDRMNLSALLVNRPLKETGESVGMDGLTDKTYWYLDDGEWKLLMDALQEAGYPVIITHVLKDGDFRSAIPQAVLDRSHLVINVCKNDLFLEVLHRRVVK